MSRKLFLKKHKKILLRPKNTARLNSHFKFEKIVVSFWLLVIA